LYLLKDVGSGGMKVAKVKDRKEMKDMTEVVYLEVLKVP
jgi:hypothetical protein